MHIYFYRILTSASSGSLVFYSQHDPLTTIDPLIHHILYAGSHDDDIINYHTFLLCKVYAIIETGYFLQIYNLEIYETYLILPQIFTLKSP